MDIEYKQWPVGAWVRTRFGVVVQVTGQHGCMVFYGLNEWHHPNTLQPA